MKLPQRTVDKKVSAIVHRGRQSPRAGLQFHVNGEIDQGFVISPANKKKPLRITVGEPGRRATVWRIWGNRNASDVYIASSSTAAIHKISIHESGDWRYQTTRNLDELKASTKVTLVALQEELSSRVIGSWQRPPSPVHGWIDVMRIVVPTTELITHPNTYETPEQVKNIEWVPPAPAGYAAEVRFFLVEPGKGSFDLYNAAAQEGGVSYWGGMTLPSGEVFVVLSSTFRVEQSRQSYNNELKQVGTDHGGVERSFDRAPRVLVPEVEQNYATFWDLAGYNE